ncbi:type II CRISPR RNA-guided endonuclease Cas9 [Isobaculum melis]|uniref:CRISPR-associated endonuclease Cas9 n=1 Tax=Isobaculum melis TaxID=142588 RepID=A0A1H9RN44_9LACT|nr:type II CRISPR RNA-guided endonuclease Cas9 [Isobaculum melis]SER73895.1 CRISPR-associated endonuclease Csn1 [Isobaculum melis]
MGYRIGLDIGITSVGYAVLRTDEKGEPIRIEHLNSVIFPIAEHPKDGKSLALPRRESRGARRRTRRTKFRKYRTKMLFIRHGLLTKNQIEKIYNQNLGGQSVYELRAKGLDQALTNEELFRIFYFFSGHRGFKSNRKSELTEKDMGPVLSAIKEIEDKLEDGNHRTLGEYMCKDEKYKERKRNKEGKERYLGTANRAMIEIEIKKIIETQRLLGNTDLSSEFEIEYIGDGSKTGIFNDQRDFEDGPGSGPYAGNQIEKMIGFCTHEPDEKRAPKASYTFQYFDLLSKLNNLKYQEHIGEKYQELTLEQKNLIKEKVLSSKEVKFSAIKKLLGLSSHARFNLVTYGSKATIEETEKKTKFYSMSSYYKLKNSLPEAFFNQLTAEQLDEIGYILTVYSSDHRRKDEFYGRLAFPEQIVESLLPINFSKFGNLSLKAMKKIMPFLEMGFNYYDASAQAGYDATYKKIDAKTIHEDVNNPVVKRAVSQTIKIVNHIISKYGKPDAISIELARELGKPHDIRKKISKSQETNRIVNERIADKLRELGIIVNGENIIRLKLWEEQGGMDPYTGLAIPYAHVFSDRYEIDHIIPYSLTLDDSYGNKVLVSGAANREKGNKIPLDYLAGDIDRIHKLEAIAGDIKNPRKREKLLKKQLTKEDIEGWKTRNLNDTRYISVLLHNYFKQNISFAKLETEKKQRVFAVNGTITAKLRARWGFNKIRENGDQHHALDALIVACVTPKYVKEVTNFSKRKEVRGNSQLWERKEYLQEIENEVVTNKEDYDRIFNQAFPYPWPKFRDEVICRMSENPSELMQNYQWKTYTDEEISTLKPIFIVRRPNKKVTGPAHQETIRSAKLKEQGKNISRVSISKLKLNKNGEIVSGNGTFYKTEDNGWQLLYEKLKNELEKNGGNGELAFPTGAFTYQHLEKSHTVRKVKIEAKTTLQAVLNEGKAVADNGSMVRIDVFRTNGKYLFVPIYVKDTVEKDLPNKACVAHKQHLEWPIVNEADFQFSLYSGDLIRIQHKTGVKLVSKDGLKETKIEPDFIGYYVGANISTASISGDNHNNYYRFESLGIATLVNLEKYQIDYFGNYYKVKEKQRQKFHEN